jgi:hypothetical protein
LVGRDVRIPEPDPAFTAEIKALLGANLDRYGIAVLDLTDLDNPRYAAYRDDLKQNVGSVGKLLVALGLFQALADAWPDDLERRAAVLRDTVMTADNFSVSDHHTIRLFNVESRELTRRPMAIGDQGSMWEYLDWMLSVSSNSAAAMVMRDAMLLRHFGKDYPVSEEQIRDFFSNTPASELTRIFQQTFWEPVTRNGLPLDQIRQGSFFTRQGKVNVSGGGNSYATPRTLMEFLLLMEEGTLVDEWSSREAAIHGGGDLQCSQEELGGGPPDSRHADSPADEEGPQARPCRCACTGARGGARSGTCHRGCRAVDATAVR